MKYLCRHETFSRMLLYQLTNHLSIISETTREDQTEQKHSIYLKRFQTNTRYSILDFGNFYYLQLYNILSDYTFTLKVVLSANVEHIPGCISYRIHAECTTADLQVYANIGRWRTSEV